MITITMNRRQGMANANASACMSVQPVYERALLNALPHSFLFIVCWLRRE